MIALVQQSNILDEVIHGEALAVLRTLPDNSVDAIVCDPPAGISFMGKDWDDPDYFPLRDRGPRLTGSGNPTESRGFARGITLDSSKKARDTFISWLSEVMAEALRVLKPGGHAFVWALPRTSHWTGMALEDTGFEIRDCVNHFYDASTLMQQFLASLTPSQSDAFKALMDSQAAPSLVSHIFGSGFPKSADISKAIDRMHGAEREVIGVSPNSRFNGNKMYANGNGLRGHESYEGDLITAPATPEASQWNGWGTSLKPASEHWWLCRKPLSEKSIAANVLKWGTGAINIDASRIGTDDNTLRTMHTSKGMFGDETQRAQGYRPNWHKENEKITAGGNSQGRWPANLLLSHSVWCVPNGVKKVKGSGWRDSDNEKDTSNLYEGEWKTLRKHHGYHYNDSEGMEQVEDWLCDESCPIRLLDEQSGMRPSSGRHGESGSGKHTGLFSMGSKRQETYFDQGGASRYFQRFYPFIYQAKASRAERNRGIVTKVDDALVPDFEEGLSEGYVRNNVTTHNGTGNYRGIDKKPLSIAANTHPTVKPVQLMRYLVRMITPPGGIVLDCFAGSGSTLVAAIHEGMHFIGIEMNDSEQEPYVSIARARIEQAFREVQA